MHRNRPDQRRRQATAASAAGDPRPAPADLAPPELTVRSLPDSHLQHVFLFVYGSLVSAKSAAQTTGQHAGDDTPGRGAKQQAGHVPATLHGWRRSWNVGSDKSSHPERTMFHACGAEFAGTVAFLGISPAEGVHVTGAVIHVSQGDLALLAVRERNYFQCDVSAAAQWAGKPANATVLTFVPSPLALTRLMAATRNGSALIRAQYQQLVHSAFAAAGDDALAAFLATTGPSPLAVLPLTTRIDGAPVPHRNETTDHTSVALRLQRFQQSPEP